MNGVRKDLSPTSMRVLKDASGPCNFAGRPWRLRFKASHVDRKSRAGVLILKCGGVRNVGREDLASFRKSERLNADFKFTSQIQTEPAINGTHTVGLSSQL
jgi:hypothetical protein